MSVCKVKLKYGDVFLRFKIKWEKCSHKYSKIRRAKKRDIDIYGSPGDLVADHTSLLSVHRHIIFQDAPACMRGGEGGQEFGRMILCNSRLAVLHTDYQKSYVNSAIAYHALAWCFRPGCVAARLRRRDFDCLRRSEFGRDRANSIQTKNKVRRAGRRPACVGL